MAHNRPVMLARFFVPDLDGARGLAVLPAEEARHLTRVLRLTVGDRIAVFDGCGHEFEALVAHAGRDGVSVVLKDPVQPPADPKVSVTLVQAVIKGDRMDDVVRDATMLGVRAVQPIVTARTVVPLGTLGRARVVDRWKRVAIASAKQCRRARLPDVRPPVAFPEWLAAKTPATRLLLLEPTAGDALPVRALLAQAPPLEAAIIIGPEGGWTSEERDAAIAAGCTAITLGPLTLRADAVPVVALSALNVVWS
jgi:16S rRNA (uracil1498-N3)-methyltransferase